ncbi:MAG: response regulator, partial [Gammaproteobacteria bacterium]|nr:response regulator [Gammaproteobacteria bacterium]
MPSYHKVALLISQNIRSVEEVLHHIQERGFIVYHTRNGSEGLKFARENKPDLIVLDVSPDEEHRNSSLERALTLLELNADDELSKITLAVTSQGTVQKSLKPVLSEMNFVTKPIQPKSMIEKIKQLVPGGVSTILVVDDDESARDIMSAAAKKAGWSVVLAENGREALEQIKKSIPSVILLDLMMPEMDGFTVITELQKEEKWRDIPIIIVSAKELSDYERILLEKHTKDIIQKGMYTRQS